MIFHSWPTTFNYVILSPNPVPTANEQPRGQVVGRIRDLPTCRELIERTEAGETIRSLQSKV